MKTPAEQTPQRVAWSYAGGMGVIDVVGNIGMSSGDDPEPLPQEALEFAGLVAEFVQRGCSKIRVRINSRGGCTFTALAMYDALRQAAAGGVTVETEVVGLAASAASLLLMAGDVRIMSENSELMVHEMSSRIWGTLEEMREGLAVLEKAWGRMVAIYCERAGLQEDTFREAHKKDVYYTAAEALAAGFITQVGAAATPLPEVVQRVAEAPAAAAARRSWWEGVRELAVRVGLAEPRKSEAETKVEQRLACAEQRVAELETECRGLQDLLARAQAERAAAETDRREEIEREVAARVAGMGLQPAELPAPGGEAAPGTAAKAEPLADDAAVRAMCATGSAVSYACKSPAHAAQVMAVLRSKNNQNT